MTKFLNISTDNTLGGNSASDVVVSSQKAIKDYVDQHGGGSTSIDDTTITRNSSQEMQAVATINANSASGATNPVYDWVGTLSEYETQAVATNHPDWVCYITDDIGGPTTVIAELAEGLNNKADLSVVNNKVDKGHQVIAYQEPTSSNSYTWYRKYADGWVEQGGQGQSSSGGSGVILPVAMANSSYFVSITALSGDIGYSKAFLFVSARTTTGFTVKQYDTNTIAWEVKGKAA